MGKTAIIYGSTTGTTEDIAGRIASKLNIAQGDIYEISKVTADTVAGYDTLLLGSSTWGSGDLQDDWYDGIETLKGADLAGKKIALFGCGDSDGYPDTFVGALAQIYDALADSGATFVGQVDGDGYGSTDTDSFRDGKFVGLPLDDADTDSHASRIADWVATL